MRTKWFSQGFVIVAAVLLLAATASAVAPGRVEIRGKIDAIVAAPPSITVMGQVVDVDPATVIMDDKLVPPVPMTFAGLLVGDTVHVQANATPLPDGSFMAVQLDRENEQELEDVEIRAAIDAITPNGLGGGTFVVSWMTVTADATTAILRRKATVMSFADLAVGKIVEVKGKTQAAGVFLASRVKIEDALDRKNVDVTAGVHGLGDDFVMEMGQKVKLGKNTVIFGRHNKKLSFAEIQLEDRVHVEAVEHVGGVLVSKKLTDDRAAARGKHVAGRIQAKTADTIKVGGKVFQIPAATQMEDRLGRKVGLNKLRRGMEVEVEFITIGTNRVARGIVGR